MGASKGMRHFAAFSNHFFFFFRFRIVLSALVHATEKSAALLFCMFLASLMLVSMMMFDVSGVMPSFFAGKTTWFFASHKLVVCSATQLVVDFWLRAKSCRNHG